MRTVIAGGHGGIALRLARLLVDSGVPVTGLVRDPAQQQALTARGASSAVVDLERASTQELIDALAGATVAVFAAGAGPGSGTERKQTVDRDGSVRLAEAAEHAGVRRFVQISAMALERAEDPSVGEIFAAYLRAKAAAEQDLRARSLDWTIVRPGTLTDEPGTGRVHLGTTIGRGEIPRDDVAAVLHAAISEPRTAGATLEVVGGDTLVEDAVRAVCDPR